MEVKKPRIIFDRFMRPIVPGEVVVYDDSLYLVTKVTRTYILGIGIMWAGKSTGNVDSVVYWLTSNESRLKSFMKPVVLPIDMLPNHLIKQIKDKMEEINEASDNQRYP